MSDHDHPPLREMPEPVRARIRARVFAEIDAGSRPRALRRLPAAAAVAVVLVLGATAWGVGAMPADAPARPAASPGDAASGTAGPQGESDAEQAAADLDRCRGTAGDAAHGAALPPRSDWHSVLHVEGLHTRVTAFVADGKPIFCEVTADTVTVSPYGAEPAYVDGSRTGALLISSAGTVAGVVDPRARQLNVSVTSPGRDGYSGPAVQAQGLFVFVSAVATDGSAVTISEGAGQRRLPPPTAPGVVTRSPAGGSATGDPASERARVLERCVALARTFVPVTGTEGWRPGAMVDAAGERLVMAVAGDQVGACLSQPSRAQVLTGIGTVGGPTSTARPTLLAVAPSLGGRPLLAGTTPPAAVRMEFELPGGETVAGDVLHGTFAVLLPEPPPPGVVVRAYDRTGRVVYEGAIQWLDSQH